MLKVCIRKERVRKCVEGGEESLEEIT